MSYFWLSQTLNVGSGRLVASLKISRWWWLDQSSEDQSWGHLLYLASTQIMLVGNVLEFYILFVGFTLPSPVMDKERETGAGRSEEEQSVIVAWSSVCFCGFVLLDIYIKNLRIWTKYLPMIVKLIDLNTLWFYMRTVYICLYYKS